MNEPISEGLRAVQRIGAEGFATTALASDLGPTVRRVARRRVGRAVGTGLAAVALVTAVAVGALGYSGRTVSPALPSPTPSSHPSAERVLITVNVYGDSETDLAEILARAGVVDSAQEFLNEASKDPASVLQILPGQYWLPRNMTASDAIAAMLDPSKRQAPNVTFAPGSTEEVIFRQLRVAVGIHTADLYEAAKDPASFGLPPEANGNVEGWLGPYDYYFPVGTTATEALSAMVEATIAHLDMMGVAPGDRQRVLTLASLVDMEAPLADDRTKIARMLLNRLAEGVPLDLEPGVSFVRDWSGAWVEQTNPKIYRPGNTYLKPGLPPAPLASPSTDSIDAVLHPADGPWLYFVPGIPPAGQTQYLTTYEEYQVAIAEFGAWMETDADAGAEDLRNEAEKLQSLQDATDADGA